MQSGGVDGVGGWGRRRVGGRQRVVCGEGQGHC